MIRPLMLLALLALASCQASRPAPCPRDPVNFYVDLLICNNVCHGRIASYQESTCLCDKSDKGAGQEPERRKEEPR